MYILKYQTNPLFKKRIWMCTSTVFNNDKSLTSSQSLFTGLPLEAWLTDALTGGTREHREAVVSAGGAATGVELLQILIPALLQVGQSRAYMVSGCAEAH